jgi:hypothetical protein
MKQKIIAVLNDHKVHNKRKISLMLWAVVSNIHFNNTTMSFLSTKKGFLRPSPHGGWMKRAFLKTEIISGRLKQTIFSKSKLPRKISQLTFLFQGVSIKKTSFSLCFWWEFIKLIFKTCRKCTTLPSTPTRLWGLAVVVAIFSLKPWLWLW